MANAALGLEEVEQIEERRYNVAGGHPDLKISCSLPRRKSSPLQKSMKRYGLPIVSAKSKSVHNENVAKC